MKRAKPTISTYRELATVLGRSPATISRWASDPKWGFGVPPFSASVVPQIKGWALENMAERGQSGMTPSEQKLKLKRAKAELRKLTAQADQAEADLRNTRIALMDREAVKTEWQSVGEFIRGGWSTLPEVVVSVAVSKGMPAEESGTLHQQVIDEITRILKPLDRPLGLPVELDDEGDPVDQEDPS